MYKLIEVEVPQVKKRNGFKNTKWTDFRFETNWSDSLGEQKHFQFFRGRIKDGVIELKNGPLKTPIWIKNSIDNRFETSGRSKRTTDEEIAQMRESLVEFLNKNLNE